MKHSKVMVSAICIHPINLKFYLTCLLPTASSGIASNGSAGMNSLVISSESDTEEHGNLARQAKNMANNYPEMAEPFPEELDFSRVSQIQPPPPPPPPRDPRKGRQLYLSNHRPVSFSTYEINRSHNQWEGGNGGRGIRKYKSNSPEVPPLPGTTASTSKTRFYRLPPARFYLIKF